MEFQGKIALVTGAAQGIGAAIALMLAQRGAAVGLLDIQSESIHAAAAAINAQHRAAIALQADISLPETAEFAIDSIERELGPLDILINNVGILHPATVLNTHDEDWEKTFAVNTAGVFRLCRSAASRMVPRKTGVIITVGSNAAFIARSGMASHAASKAASLHFTRCLGLELAPHGIRCNTVSPGSTDTAMQRQLGDDQASRDAILRGSLDSYRTGIPLARIAEPQDIAEAVCFLASERARHITLTDIRVDAGATLGA